MSEVRRYPETTGKPSFAYDIDGNEVRVGDRVTTTEEGLRRKNQLNDGWHVVGEVLVVGAIYRYPIKDGGAEIVLDLANGYASIYRTDPSLYRLEAAGEERT